MRRVLRLRVGGRIYRTVFTPDRKAGGYWVSVPDLPGCLTEGDTLKEAKRMARDAVALWLDVADKPPIKALRQMKDESERAVQRKPVGGSGTSRCRAWAEASGVLPSRPRPAQPARNRARREPRAVRVPSSE